LGIRALLSGKIEVRNGDGVVVDEVDFTGWPNNMFLWILPGAREAGAPPNYAQSASSAEVNDPRLNHNQGNWKKESAPTPWILNKHATEKGNLAEGVSPMYVRNFPLDLPKALVGRGSVAELGYLSVGEPWRTIALYNTPDQNLHRVLDYFTLETNTAVRGKVNINSRNLGVLASALYEMKLDQYPGEDTTKRMSVDGAAFLASNVITRLGGGVPARHRGNRSTSVLGEFDISFCGNLDSRLSSPALTNDAARESILRNAHELFGVRQNLYTIFVYAQTMTPAGALGAEQRAVAVVWRDPEEDVADTGAAGSGRLNRTFVRYFKWL
jgi:hypothetical protein